MIVFINGDILKTKADAIVNPVNCEGVMGKGLAYQIKIKYPKTYEAYSLACKQGELQTGKIHSFSLYNLAIFLKYLSFSPFFFDFHF